MADAKKKAPKKEEGPKPSPVLEILFWAVLALFLFNFVHGIFVSINTPAPSIPGVAPSPTLGSQISSAAGTVFSAVSVLAVFMALLFFMGIIYADFLIGQMKKKGIAAIQGQAKAKQQAVADTRSNSKWEKIQAEGDSENPNDWRLAIIEADVMLDEMLEKMGYHGTGIGDRLKQIEKSDFQTIDDAWEAHKVRNLIAHEGSDYVLSQREAKRIIGLYEKVFKEFFVI